MIQLFDDLVSILFPHHCLGCECLLDDSEQLKFEPSNCEAQSRLRCEGEFAKAWCQRCWERLGHQTAPCCFRCSAILKMPFFDSEGDQCVFCEPLKPRFERAVAVGNYSGLLRDLILKMKNLREERIAIQLGKILAVLLQQQPFWSEVNLVVSVPTFWRKRLVRRFSAPDVLAEMIEKVTGKLFCRGAVKAIRATKKQGTLSISRRKTNVKDAFVVVRPEMIKGQNVVVIDDVMTSGETVNALAKVLLDSGAAKVFVGMVGRGVGVR